MPLRIYRTDEDDERKKRAQQPARKPSGKSTTSRSQQQSSQTPQRSQQQSSQTPQRSQQQTQQQAQRELDSAAARGQTSGILGAARRVLGDLTNYNQQQAQAQEQQDREQIEAQRQLYAQTQANQQRAVQADLDTRRAQAQQTQRAASGLYSAYAQQQEQAARAQEEQDRARIDAGRQLYAQTQANQQRAVQADLDTRRAQTDQMRNATQGLYSAYLQGEQDRARAQEEQDRARMAGLQGVYGRLAGTDRDDRGGYNGEYMAGVLGRVDERESSLYESPYAEILTRQDYAENARPGESKSGWGFNTDSRYDYINDINGARETLDYQMRTQHAGQDYAKYALMTDDEIGVYNYLYKTEGRRAADAYLQQLEPELNAQWFSGAAANNAEEATRNAGTAALYSAATVLGQPTRTLTSAMANVEDAWRTATGQGIDPYSDLRMASMMTSETRGAIAGKIEEGAGGKIGSFAYNTAMSALDSVMNAMVAGQLGAATGLSGEALMHATNIIGSVTMSSEVMALATAENKQKGYSDVGALTLGLIRGAIEYASEALGGEWVISNIKANPLNLVKTMVLSMIPEGVEEVMSDAANGLVNLYMDALFGTQESGIPALMEHFSEEGSGWQQAHPDLATALAILGQEGLSFLGGAFATFGSSGTQYANNRSSINRTAQRLNASAQDVVQLMERYDTDNPGQIEALAEIFDAGSVEELTERMAENETAEETLDRIMRGEGKGSTATEENAENDAAGLNNPSSAPDGAPSPQGEGFTGVNINAPGETRGALDTAQNAQNENAPAQAEAAAARSSETEQSGQQEQGTRGTAQDNYKYFADDVEDAAEYFKQEHSGGDNVYSRDYHSWTWSVQKKSDGTFVAYAADNSQRSGAFVPNQDVGSGYATAEEAARAALEYCYAHESEEDWNRYTNNRGRNAAAGTEAQQITNQNAPAQAEAGGTNSHKPSNTSLQSDSDIEAENIKDGTDAANKLMEQAQTSDDPESLIVRNAMYRSDLGPIDFKWGTPGRGAKFKGGYGLAHIIAKRNAENGRGLATVNSIIEAIAKAENADYQYSNNQSEDYHRVRLYFGDATVVLSKEPGGNHWLLTGWENNETATNATGEVHDSSGATAATPTRTRRSGDATVSNNSIRDSSGNSNPQNENSNDLSQNSDSTVNGTNTEENAQKTGKNAQSQENVPAGNGTRTEAEIRREIRERQRPVLRTDPRVVFGSRGKTYTNTDTVDFQYAIVPLDTLLTSHDRYGNSNAEYPAELQPRDRTRATSQGDIDRMARTLNPDLLADSKTAQNGAPIVTDTGIVISGNGRTAAIQAAYESGNSEAYQQYLQEHAAEFGIDPRAIPENPVLVRVAKDSGNAAQLARDLNVTTTAAMSATETAQVDADKLQDLMDSVVLDEDAAITAASNRGFVQRFVEEIVPESERGAMYDANGNLSKAGLTRIQNAIFATAYGDESRLARLAEYTDDTAKNITKALVTASNDALQLQSSVKNGTSYDVDVTGAIMRALDLYEQSRAEGRDFADFMAQYRMDNADGTAWDIAQFIAAHKRSAKAIGEYFSALYSAAQSHDPNQISMFGGEENGPTAQDVLREGERSYLAQKDGNYLGYEPGEAGSYQEADGKIFENSGSTGEGAVAERALGVSESDTEAQREADRVDAELAGELTTPRKPGKGIDIVPGEGEEAVSSANGLTDEDNEQLGGGEPTYYDGTFPASDLFGPSNAEKEAKAMDTATKEGNAALKEFAESMPDDPMDLYKQQEPVSTKKIPGQEKISTGKAAEEKTMREKASEAWHGFIRSMVNEADAIHQAGRRTGNKALDGMYFYAKAATLRAQQWIQGDRMDFNLENSGAGLNAIFDPIRAKGNDYYRDFQLYVYHTLNVERMSRSFGDEVRRAQQLADQIAAADPSVAAMTDDTLREKARQYKESGGLGFVEDEEKGELIYEYWQARQELQRAEKGKNKPVFGFGEDSPGAEESAKIARDLLAAHPDFEKEAQGVYDYCDALLQYRVDAGLITEANRQTLKSTYPHYVPVMYDYENVPEKIRKGGISVSSTVKGAKGGSTNLLPLHYALSRQTLAVMRNAGYQQLGAEVLKEYENNSELMGKYVLNAEENEAVWDESMADNDDVMKPHENVISVFRDGIRYDLTLSKDMSFAFNSLQPGRQDAAGWQMMAKGNDLFKKLCTAYNPLFMITNPIRDVQDAVFYSTDTARWMKNYPKAIAQIAGSGKFWQMYKSMGGVNNSYFDWATGENAGKRNGKLGRIEALNMAIEQAPRLAEFMTVLENAQRKNGEITQADRMEAFNAAAEITTNFSRGGTQGKWINRNLVPFWNPGVQGLSKAVRTVTETKGFKAWAGLTLKAAALGMLPALLNGLLYRDDDEWDVIDDQMKMDYYLFKGKDGVWIKIPKGRVLAALSAPVVGMQESLRGDDVDWGGLAKSAFGSVAPNNPFESNLFSTAMQAQLFDPDDPGKTWYGGNIESKRLQGYAPGERYDESTDILSKWLGGKLNISPKKLSYVLDQYSGVLGDLILPYLTPKAERGAYFGDSGIPVPFSNAFMSRFTMDTVTSNTISDEYYGLLDELGYAAKAGDKPSAVAERYLNRAGSTISDYYAQIREIENDTNLSDAEKSRLTRELRKKLNEYEQQITSDAAEYLESAQKYLEDHPEFDYTDDAAVNAFVEGYNSQQSSEKYYIDADTAASKMKDEVYREVNREHFGAEYALQAYSKDTYAKARELHDTSGVSYDDYYDYYFGTRYMFADKDAEGKPISGTKSDKIVEFLEGMKLSDEHRNALYQAAGFSGKYPAGITSYLDSHPEYDFSDGKSITAFMEGYNSMQSSEKYYIDEEKAKSKMRDEVYREIYRDEYGAEYALQWYSKDTYKKATELKNTSGLSYDDYYDYYFGTRYLFSDKDENGKTISGSRKEKIVDFIDGMDISDKQKDALYLAAGYTSKDIKTTPWHGGSGKYTSGGRRRSRGGRRGGRRSRSSGGSIKINQVGKITPTKSTAGTMTGKLSTTGSGSVAGKTSGTSAGMSLLEIVNRYYDGNPLAAAMDGGRKARTSVDFKL